MNIEFTRDEMFSDSLLLMAKLEVEEGFETVLAHPQAKHSFQAYEQIQDQDLGNKAIETFTNTDLADNYLSTLKENLGWTEDGGTFSINHLANIYQVDSLSYVMMEITCRYQFAIEEYHETQDYDQEEEEYYEEEAYFQEDEYATIFVVWQVESDEFTIVEELGSDYSPLFLQSEDQHILGFFVDKHSEGPDGYSKSYRYNYDGIYTLFQHPEWKKYQYLEASFTVFLGCGH